MFDRLRKAFRVSVPLVAVSTPDQHLFVRMVAACLPEETTVYQTERYKTCVLVWDCVRGLSIPVEAKNRKECHAALKALSDRAGMEAEDLIHPHLVLQYANSLRPGSVLIMMNLYQSFGRPDVVQALSVLRDDFKIDRRMIIMTAPSQVVPLLLRDDVIEMVEPRPTTAELQAHLEANLQMSGLGDAANACLGHTCFGAEQAVLLNMAADAAIDLVGVHQDKCARVSQVPGLRVVPGRSYDSIAGVAQLKALMSRVMAGSKRPGAVVWLDEFEKAIGGAAADTSGVSQDQLRLLLHWMEENKAGGCLLVGDPGTAKSAFVTATGGEHGVPVIEFDLGAMKGSLVGESEGRIREALSMVKAVSGGRTLWMATANSLDRIPPEMRRRFRYGTWYFPSPDLEERQAIWSLYCARFGLDSMDAVDLFDRAWTGAEIETCCDLAAQTGMSLVEASEFVAPVSGDPKVRASMEALQSLADGAFLSVSKPGVWRRPLARDVRPEMPRGRRSVGL